MEKIRVWNRGREELGVIIFCINIDEDVSKIFIQKYYIMIEIHVNLNK